ncbi:hypothetical protein [Bifidobacterium pseudocatenulatum]|uniref:hypothetical protein n=1 Tax=Bifidobacterium pseudocatenulatum TaxID=28026 RepID=UPI00189B674D|nr:hypothetical protein [Bifidobacterium pseudocatenulatum]MDB6519326.1 hypothetical protein [Bifidobacterium pseudocatenulatum]MDB6522787.1 hypothetical protein [Bifidobacterium pseudocatenulatum]MDB6524556.1 hypothetical protein [Bifidobacterium pseudocatenulatum]MDB6526352.1 hypothetical protein [Bifidobacterium pseudocatenulatum]MDB6528195.1 hypothetical protein [Bifidobacterium pseudocatenulatum]
MIGLPSLFYSVLFRFFGHVGVVDGDAPIERGISGAAKGALAGFVPSVASPDSGSP